MYFSGDVFHGKWEDNMLQGENCFMMYRNGDYFQGNYRAGMRAGYGKYQFASG